MPTQTQTKPQPKPKPLALEIDLAQGSPEWLEARAGLATASNFVKVMMNPTTAGYQEYVTTVALERLNGKPFETYKSAPMQRGNDLEPIARMLFTLRTKTLVEESGMFVHQELPVGCSLDGKIGDDGIWENKSPLRHNHLYTLRQHKVPPQYVPQVQGQLWLTERKYTMFTSYSDEFPQNAQFAIVRVERDEDYINNKLLPKLMQFLEDVEAAIQFIVSYKEDV